MNRTLLVAALAAGLIAAPALAADPPPSGEHLVVAPYPGGAPWQTVTDKRNDFQSMIEIIPADQSVTAIKDIIVEQTFFKLKNQDPSAFIGGLLQRLSRSCASARINGPKAGTQNGYPVAYGQSYCVGVRGEDVDSFLKAIAGKDALYLVQREFHRPTTPGALAGVRSFSSDELPKLRALMSAQKIASDFTVDGVQVCPPVGGDGPCPSARLPEAAKAAPP
jgi:hypothetical protein